MNSYSYYSYMNDGINFLDKDLNLSAFYPNTVCFWMSLKAIEKIRCFQWMVSNLVRLLLSTCLVGRSALTVKSK